MTAGPPLLVGVTATRHGATGRQLAAALAMLQSRPVAELHHGDCVGGDAQLDALAQALGIPRAAHPPDNPKHRAFCPAERVLSPEPYLARNRAIVHATGVLVALPRTPDEEHYGGTWATVRYARSRGRPVFLVTPAGVVLPERDHGLIFPADALEWAA